MSLNVILENAGKEVLLVHVSGAIDLAASTQWEQFTRQVIRLRSSVVIVDLRQLEYISARGLKMLLALAANQSLLNGCLVVAGANAATRRAAQLVGLWELAVDVSSVRAAMQKAEDYKAARGAALEMVSKTRSQSKRMARQSGEA